MTICKYDEAARCHTLNDKPVLSVTQALQFSGVIDSQWFTEDARERGTEVHKYMKDYFDFKFHGPEPIPDNYMGYIKALHAFVLQTGFMVRYCEKIVYREDLGYVGRCDLVGILGGKPMLLDVKTGNLPSWLHLQLIAYGAALAQARIYTVCHFGLRLFENGRYKLTKINTFNSWYEFCRCLSIAKESEQWQLKLNQFKSLPSKRSRSSKKPAPSSSRTK